MSKAADELREHLGIFNPSNACTFAALRGGSGVYLDYRTADHGRAGHSAAWLVVRPGHATDPGGYWRNYGHKTFVVGISGSRAKAETAAKGWAEAEFGITDWVKIPGCPEAWFPAGDAQIVKDALRAAKAARS